MRRVMLMRWTLSSVLPIALFVLSAPAALGDALAVLPEGVKHLEEIKKQLQPAPAYVDQRGQTYFVGFVVDARPARDVTSKVPSIETRPSFRFIACDKSGKRRSKLANLSAFWVRIIVNDMDTLLDLRLHASGGNVFEKTEVGTRRHMTELLRALDPDGALGIAAKPGSAPKASQEGMESVLVRYLKHPPGRGKLADWGDAERKALEERRPLITLPSALGPPGSGFSFAADIARGRRYPIHEPGFERAAFSIILLRTNLIVVDPALSDYAKRLHEHGREAARSMLNAAAAATPREADASRPPLEPLEKWLKGITDPRQREQVTRRWERYVETRKREEEAIRAAAEAKAKLRALGREGPRENYLPVHDAEVASAAIDVLSVSEAPYHFNRGFQKYLVETCTQMGRRVKGRSTQDDAPIDVRPRAIKLMVRLLNPRPSRNKARQKRRLEAAESYRGLVTSRLHGEEEEQRAVFDILSAAGWRADESTLGSVGVFMGVASESARNSFSEDPETKRVQTKRMLKTLRLLHEFSLLAHRDDPEEIKIGQTVLDWVKDHRKSEYTSSKMLIRAWDDLSSGSGEK